MLVEAVGAWFPLKERSLLPNKKTGLRVIATRLSSNY
jgi:hypothetical protein